MDQIVSVVITFLPFLVILWLANFADRSRQRQESGLVFAALSYGLLVLIYFLFIIIGLLSQASSVLAANGTIPAAQLGNLQQLGLSSADLGRIGIGLWLPSLFGLLLLVPIVRRALARRLPVDPASSAQAVALSYSMLVLINLLVTLGIGLGTLADLYARPGTITNLLPSQLAQTVFFLLLSAIGVGWLSRRSLGSALQRLGVVVPSLGQLGFGLGIGIVLAIVSVVVEYLLSRVGIRTSPDVNKLTEQLIGPLFSTIPGVLLIGLSAGLGEEVLFRGALLPRFGLLITSLLFALLHSNYGISESSAFVFVLALVFGLVRYRTNTSTAMIVHATYDIVLGLLSYFAVLQNF